MISSSGRSTVDDKSAPLPPSSPIPDVVQTGLTSSSLSASRTASQQPIADRRELDKPESETDTLPRTPSKRQVRAAAESDSVAPSSEYYTATWGSPYELSPSTDLRSIHTAISEQIRSDDYLSSPETPFGLEHLFPSRLGNTALPESQFLDTELLPPVSEAGEPTPRPAANRWIPLPKRAAPEKPQWWSEDSGDSQQEDNSARSAASRSASSHVRGHKKRRDNRTLDQQAYLELVRGSPKENMSGLAASRWAATPVQEEEKSLASVPLETPAAEQKKTEDESVVLEAERTSNDKTEKLVDVDESTSNAKDVETEKIDLITGTNAETGNEDNNIAKEISSQDRALDRPVAEVSDIGALEPTQTTSWAEEVEASQAEALQQQIDQAQLPKSSQQEPSIAKDDLLIDIAADVVQTNTSPSTALPSDVVPATIDNIDAQPRVTATSDTPVIQPFRLEPPRFKKRVVWRNKNCMINIPSLDFNALGLPFPMTLDEARERIAQAHVEFDDPSIDDDSTIEQRTAHVRPIFPDEKETRTWRRGQRAVVSLPDLNAWRNYENALVEAKLAALGVSQGDDSPPQSEDMSRQSSNTYQQPFSPPLPTSSANSVVRPGFVRGHSHTMSVASPITPGNGPFGHMHRHSTFHGFSPLQAQDFKGLPGPQAFSPASPFNIPTIPQIASPAQLNALRNEYGVVRGPGSPLSQSMTPEPIDLQRQRLQGLISQPPLPPSQLPTRGFGEQISALPELPEDEDEEELSDPVPYVPPHKRAQINDDIVVPTPRHRHNISEGLEREVLHIEQQRESKAADSSGRLDGFAQAPKLFGQVSDLVPPEKDPLSGDLSVQESGHNHKRSGSRFNVPAATFTFNPAANFKPSSSSFKFGGASAAKPSNANHTRRVSSGTFNVAAPEFKPSSSLNGPPPPSSDFSFSTQGPVFLANAPTSVPPSSTDSTIVDQLPSIFGKVEIPDIVKPVKKSKAVAIVRPSLSPDQSATATDAEDAQGRTVRADDRPKRSRRADGDDGDDVPLFATPSPVPPLPTVPIVPSQHVSISPLEDKPLPEVPDTDGAVPPPVHSDTPRESNKRPSESPTKPEHKANRSSLSARAQPWQPSGFKVSSDNNVSGTDNGREDLEDGELPQEIQDDASSDRRDIETKVREPTLNAPVYPSFDEIDAVMQHLNAADDSKPAATAEDAYEPQPGVQYLSTWPRSDAPSPDPRDRHLAIRPVPSADQLDLSNRAGYNASPWQEVNRLNRAPGPPSDWSDMLSPADDDKLQARSSFFDNRIDDVVGRVLADRLKPFEDALQGIQLTLKRSTPIEHRPSKQRSSSTIDSDADDEDESDLPRHRPISRGREEKFGHIKAIVLEALREQSPQRSHSTNDLADIHGALADMKVSFARAASSSLELDDIRAIVEDVVAKQPAPPPPAPASIAADEKEIADHKRQLAELEGKLNDTLSNALEQANRMHDVEQREADTRRKLKLAEEELRLLREDNADDDTRVRAFEGERTTFIERIDQVEEARAKAEDHADSLRAENEALQETLDEYRLSSKKWRQAAEESKLEHDALQSTVSALERQLQDTQESGSGMRRRLEKLHSDMATASGQLASEKKRWTVREEALRAQCEALENQNAINTQEKLQLEEEVQVLRVRAAEVDSAKQAFDGLRFNNASLDEMIGGLRGELQSSRALAAQWEHEFQETREAGRAEMQRMRLALELDVETANHRVNLVRAELESEVARVRAELDSVRLEADTAKEKHALLLEEEAEIRNANLQQITKSSSTALNEARLKYEGAIRELTQQHNRSLAHAIEDKERSEYLLNERLVLADSKLQHYQDKILHLQERVEVAKSAAQAAVMSAQSSKTAQPAPIARTRNAGLPEKISPQALRESILVLQEQLQERESRIESLQQKLKREGPAKIKERDDEIAWLRELLTVRGEELTDLINTLSMPTFDRDAVRDTAIRIRANLQMEQQEKERKSIAPLSAGQAIASLSSFATPKAAQLSEAFNKWRTNMESSALKSSRAASASANRSGTPSRAPSRAKGTYSLSGLMTPPASNLRSSPSPEATSTVPAPKLSTRRESKAKSDHERSDDARDEPSPPQDEEPPSTPNLFGTGHYDDDAEDKAGDMSTLEDDDLNIADSQPPAFRSLEDELNEPSEAGAEA